MSSSTNTNNPSVDLATVYWGNPSTKANDSLSETTNANEVMKNNFIIVPLVLVVHLVAASVYFIGCKRHKLFKLYRAFVYNRKHKESLAEDMMDTDDTFDAASSTRTVHQPIYGTDQSIISTKTVQPQQNHEYVNSEMTPIDHSKARQPVSVSESYTVIDEVPKAQKEPDPDLELDTIHNRLINIEQDGDSLAKFHHYTLPRTCNKHNKKSIANIDEVYAAHVNETKAQRETKPNIRGESTPKMEEKPKTKIQNKYMKSCHFNLEIKKSINIQSCKMNESAYVNYLGIPSAHLDDNHLCRNGERLFDYRRSSETSWKSETNNIVRNNKQYIKATLKEKYLYQNVRRKSGVTSFRDYVNADQKLKMCSPPKCVSFIRYVNMSSPVRELNGAEMSQSKMCMTRENNDYENPDQFVEYKVKSGNVKRLFSTSALPDSSELVKKAEIGFDDNLPMPHPQKCQQIAEDIYTHIDSTHIGKASYINDSDDQEQTSAEDYINMKTNTIHHSADPHMHSPPKCSVFSTRYINYCSSPQTYANCFESTTLQKY